LIIYCNFSFYVSIFDCTVGLKKLGIVEFNFTAFLIKIGTRGS